MGVSRRHNLEKRIPAREHTLRAQSYCNGTASVSQCDETAYMLSGCVRKLSQPGQRLHFALSLSCIRFVGFVQPHLASFVRHNFDQHVHSRAG